MVLCAFQCLPAVGGLDRGTLLRPSRCRLHFLLLRVVQRLRRGLEFVGLCDLAAAVDVADAGHSQQRAVARTLSAAGMAEEDSRTGFRSEHGSAGSGHEGA